MVIEATIKKEGGDEQGICIDPSQMGCMYRPLLRRHNYI
jgi:hypothetical protein